ncbi:uncharacterized protein LOC121973509 [Zingiber officinale]|uniref:uncharacterized protein LOC121973509 n=1 Tax=Zingiber officinale TaxID=94328 RepID=UPI001C4DB5B9|nr:uncharacterized protein LOC121973509 [Zingiber officinale]
MRDSVSRHHNVQPTRRSSRLKFLREVYESDVRREDGSTDIQKHVNKAGPGLTKRIKIEMVEKEDETFSFKSGEQDKSYPYGTFDDQIDIPLKDLRKRCRNKTQKFPKAVSPLEVVHDDYSNNDQSVEQEEPDLEEPIIKLKQRHLKGSMAHNKRRKSASVSLDPLVSTSLSYQLADIKQGFLLAVKDDTVNKVKDSEDTIHQDLKTTGGTHFLKDGSPIVLKEDPVGAESHSKTEDYHSVSATSTIGSFQKDYQLASVVQQSPNSILRNTSNSKCLTVSFPESHGVPVESFELPRDIPNDDVSEKKQLPPMPSKSQLYQAGGESTDDSEPENSMSIHDIDKEHISSLPNQNDIPSVSQDMRVSPDCCNEEAISAPVETHLANRSENENQRTSLLDEITHGIQVEENNSPSKSTYIQVKEVTNNHNLGCKEVYGLAEIFLCGKENPCCDLINDASTANLRQPVPFSQTCSIAVNKLCSAVESLTKAESFCEVENSLKEQVEKRTDFSSQVSSLTTSDGLAKLNVQSLAVAPLSANPSSVLQYTNNNSVKNTDNINYAVREKFVATSNQETMSSISLVDETRNEQPECAEEMLEDHSPIKLLSYRKTLSPTSQEKLCQVLSDIGLQDVSQLTDSPEKSKRLSLDKWTNVMKPSCIPSKKEAQLLMDHDHTYKKHWDCSNGTPIGKRTLKFQEISGKMPSCMMHSTSDMHMEKVIEFSQQQMHDIERIATQLLKKLNTMKTIVETNVTLQAPSSLDASFTSEEIKAAAEDVSELEKTTKKWLSIMKKDCIRFCKIMRSTENKSTVPANGTQKRRRITFADEVGGKLCHVKVFKQQPPSPSTARESEHEMAG